MDLIDINELRPAGDSKVVKRVPILTDKMVATTLFLNPNNDVPFHSHEDVDELHYIIDGKGIVRLGDKTEKVRQGMLFLVPRNTAHSYATENERLMVLSISVIADKKKEREIGIERGKKR